MFRTALVRQACVLSIVATTAWSVLGASASAVTPTGTEGTEPVRNRTTTAVGQAVFRQSPAWKAFTEGEGAGWSVRVDERTGTPHRMWGAGIDLGELTSADDVEKALRGFIGRHEGLLGATADAPLRSVAYDRDTGIWYADFATQRDGIDVWRSATTFRIEHGALVLVGAATYPGTPARGAFVRSDDEALRGAIAEGPAPSATHTDVRVRPLWLPRVEANLLVLRAVYEVRTHTEAPLGDWVSFVDAESGELLAYYNDVRFFAGTLHAEHDTRFPGSGTTTSPVKGAVITNGQTATVTDASGAFSIADGGNYQAHFLSDPVELYNAQGDLGLNFDASQPNPTWTATNGSMAVNDTWVFVHEVRDAFNVVVPNLDWTDGDMQVTVNINESCNAYYDGTLNFFTAGQGCNNTGRLADVVYHEWGHGLHVESILVGSFDGALSEGAGDVTSFLMTGDPGLAPGFFTNGSVLRRADNTNTYPQDLVGEVHEDGMIFAGAMWDVRQNLVAAYGEAAGVAITKDIFTGLLKGGPDLTEALDEALLADDDDGNLANGTPHQCAIVDGFAAHGLGQQGNDLSFAAGHLPIVAGGADQPLPIQVEIVGPASCAGEFQSGSAVATWRANGGAWQDATLTAVGMQVNGAIPAQPIGTFVEYYVTVSGAGDTLRAPSNGARNPFSFYVGDAIPVHCDDFEADDGGYSSALIAGQPGDGADDWQRGAPGGQAGDPVVAHSGANVWGNDLGVGNFNGQYQDDKNNRLTGPEVPLRHYEGAFLQYWRWLTVEDGIYDQASIFANGQSVWSNLDGAGQDHHQDDQWAPHAVDLGNPSGSVQIAFDLVSDGGLTMGGWNIDDVCVMVPATVNNRLGVTDFNAGEGLDGLVSLRWTNPEHAPLAEIRIVRKEGSCPADVTDGDVVFYDNAPVLGGSMTATDAVPTTNTYCYGVFPGDGSAFLGFSVPGWNTDEGSAKTPATPEQLEEQAEDNGLDALAQDDPEAAGVPGDMKQLGCGCSGTGSLGLTGGWLVGLVLLARRR